MINISSAIYRIFLLSVFIFSAYAAEASDYQSQRAKDEYIAALNAFNSRQFGTAVYHFERAYALRHFTDYHYNLGGCYDLMGKYDDALWHYRTYIQRYPQEWAVSFVLARINQIDTAPYENRYVNIIGRGDGPPVYRWISVKRPPVTSISIRNDVDSIFQ